MASSRWAVAAATAAVLVDGRRTGSAVLVDDRHLLTAAHVLRAAGTAHRIEVLFPTGPAAGLRAGAEVVSLSDLPVDIAVLEIKPSAAQPPPRAVTIWPAGAMPGRVEVLGYPRGERQPVGVWRTFEVAGPVGDGKVQLDWSGGVGTLSGHSGGPVVDVRSAALVGVLVEGSERGHFDRFVPVTVVSQYWSGLLRPWFMTGSEGRDHFARRASGQHSDVLGGDLFRGRQTAVATIRDWMTSPADPGRPLVVTGRPGAGKSAVVARAALTLEADAVTPGLAFHARGATHTQVLRAVADLVGVEGQSRRELLDALAEARTRRPWLIVVDALDEAASAADRQQIAETLTEMAALPALRVTVATRALTVGNAIVPGGLLPALGVQSSDTRALVNLEADVYFDPLGLEQFAAALLAQEGAVHPHPAGAAWERYRSDESLRQRLAAAIASRAQRNYLVAAMTASRLSTADDAVDPANPSFDYRSVPSGVGEALDQYLNQLPEKSRPRVRGLLTALAYARGDGVDDRLWLRFAAALGYPAEVPDLDRLRASAAADYLLQNVRDNTGPVTRLFHQALGDELLSSRHAPSDERVLLGALRDGLGSGGWRSSPDYPRRHAAEHAAIAGELQSLLNEVDYLAVADFTRLLPLLAPGTPVADSPTGELVRRVGSRAAPLPPDRRLRLLALAAAHLGIPDLPRQLAAAAGGPVRPRWAHSLGTPHRELTGHTGPVYGVAVGELGGRGVVVSGAAEGVRLWDALTGQPLGRLLSGHDQMVNGVAIGNIEGRQLVASASWDSTVRLWDLSSGRPTSTVLAGHEGAVHAVAIGRIGGRDLVVSGSDDGTVRVWDPSTGQLVGDPLRGHTGWLHMVAVGRVGDRDVVVSCGDDGTVRIWDPRRGRQLGDPLDAGAGAVYGVALGRVGDRDVIASASYQGPIFLWDAARREMWGDPLHGHSGWVHAVALGRVGDQDVVASASEDGTVRVWDVHSRELLGPPMTGHTARVQAVAVGRLGHRDVVVSGSQDTTVRIWEPEQLQSRHPSMTGHTSAVNALALGRVGGRGVLASASRDQTVGLWDPASGKSLGPRLTGHTAPVQAVALGRAGQRDVVLAGGEDGTIRVWDAETGHPLGEPVQAHADSVEAVVLVSAWGRDLLVSGSRDTTISTWDLGSGLLQARLLGHTSWITALATGVARGREILASASRDGSLHIWDPVTGQPLGQPLIGHEHWVNAVAVGRLEDRDVVVSGGEDRTVRIWDPVTGEPAGPVLASPCPVEGVAMGRIGDQDVVAAASSDGTVRIWVPGDDLAEVAVLDLLGRGPVALNGDVLCAATATAVCGFTLLTGRAE